MATDDTRRTGRIWTITQEHAVWTITHLQEAGKLVHDPATDCLNHRVSTSGTCRYGQAQVQWPSDRQCRSRGRTGKAYRPAPGFEGVKLLVHQLSFFARFGERPLKGEDVSHLCHNERCANPDHLCIEPHVANMSRHGCQATVTVTIACPHPEVCGELHRVSVDMCAHTPKCIRGAGSA